MPEILLTRRRRNCFRAATVKCHIVWYQTSNRKNAVTAMRDAVARLMKPRSVAIVGVSPEPGQPGGNIVKNLDGNGFTGALHLVSRNRDEVYGHPCVKTIDDLPDGIDVVVLCIPERAVVEAVEACARKHMGNVMIFAAGFAEVGGDGLAAQQRIAKVARDVGMGIIGPNCLGVTNSLEGGQALVFGTSDGRKVSGQRPTLAIVAQSGALAGIFRTAIQNRGLPVSYSVSSGNEAVLTSEDYLDYMLDDPAVGVVAMYVEQLRDPPRFLDLAARARRLKKPIVMLHAGSSPIARESAVTHTYSITRNYRAMRALTARAGVVLVEKMEELLDTAELFLYFPTPPAMGPAVMADSGAYKGLALDYAGKIGIELPKFSPHIHEALVPVMPVYAPPANPLDMTAQAIKEPEMYDKSLPLMLSDPKIGGLVLAPIMGATGFGLAKGQRILKAVKGAAKPVIMSNLGIDNPPPPELVDECRAAGIPYFPSPDRALRALAYLAQYARALARPETEAGGAMPKPAAPPADALQLKVRALRDPEWGPLLEIGFGGTRGEALQDTIIVPADLAAADVEAELRTLPGATLFEGRDLGEASATISQIGAALRGGAADLTATVPV
jgi:acyl-CoA synthetase (NDP forming)